MADELYTMLATLVENQRELQDRVARLETLEGSLFENDPTFPTPAYSGQLHQNAEGLWQFDITITDATHPLGRWKSSGGAQPAQMGQFAAGDGSTTVNAPTGGVQVANFLVPPNSRDIYIYTTNHTLHVVGQNNVGRYWSVNNYINTVDTSANGAATVTKIVPYNRVVLSGASALMFVATVDTAVTGTSTIIIDANALWYVTLGD